MMETETDHERHTPVMIDNTVDRRGFLAQTLLQSTARTLTHSIVDSIASPASSQTTTSPTYLEIRSEDAQGWKTTYIKFLKEGFNISLDENSPLHAWVDASPMEGREWAIKCTRAVINAELCARVKALPNAQRFVEDVQRQMPNFCANEAERNVMAAHYERNRSRLCEWYYRFLQDDVLALKTHPDKLTEEQASHIVALLGSEQSYYRTALRRACGAIRLHLRDYRKHLLHRMPANQTKAQWKEESAESAKTMIAHILHSVIAAKEREKQLS